MKPDDFEHLCETLYDLTSAQRDGLLNLLQSRVWLYESADNSEFERIYEFDDSAIKIILRETPIEELSYALKGVTEDFIKRFSRNMTKADANRLVKKMKALGPIRLSERNQAQQKILETINRLSTADEIELPSSAAHFIVETSATFGTAAKDDALRLQARVLLTLHDGGLRALIREIDAPQWGSFLWYINHPRLTRKVFTLSSPHLVNVMMNDFAERWQGVNLKFATEMQLETGRRAMQQVLETLFRMADEGLIFIPNRE